MDDSPPNSASSGSAVASPGSEPVYADRPCHPWLRFLKRLLAWQDRVATKRNLIILAVLYPLFPAVLLPAVVDTGGAPILDLLVYYNAATVDSVLSQYTTAMRQSYMLGALTVDMLYPLYYAISLSLLLTYVMAPRHYEGRLIEALRLLPLSVFFADAVENLVLYQVVGMWPDTPASLANLAGYLTLLKWTLLITVFILVLVMAIKNYQADRARGSRSG